MSNKISKKKAALDLSKELGPEEPGSRAHGDPENPEEASKTSKEQNEEKKELKEVKKKGRGLNKGMMVTPVAHSQGMMETLISHPNSPGNESRRDSSGSTTLPSETPKSEKGKGSNDPFSKGIRKRMVSKMTLSGVPDPVYLAGKLFPTELNENDENLFDKVALGFDLRAFERLSWLLFDKSNKEFDIGEELRDKILSELTNPIDSEYRLEDAWAENISKIREDLIIPLRKFNQASLRNEATLKRVEELKQFDPYIFFGNEITDKYFWLVHLYNPLGLLPSDLTFEDDPIRDLKWDYVEHDIKSNIPEVEFFNLLHYVRQINLLVRSNENRPFLWDKIPGRIGDLFARHIYNDFVNKRITVDECAVARLWLAHLNVMFGFYKRLVTDSTKPYFVYYRTGGPKTELEEWYENSRVFIKGKPKNNADVGICSSSSFQYCHRYEGQYYTSEDEGSIENNEEFLTSYRFRRKNEIDYLNVDIRESSKIQEANASSRTNDSYAGKAVIGRVLDKNWIPLVNVPSQKQSSEAMGFQSPLPTRKMGMKDLHRDSSFLTDDRNQDHESDSHSDSSEESSKDDDVEIDNVISNVSPRTSSSSSHNKKSRTVTSQFVDMKPAEPIFNNLSKETLKRAKDALNRWQVHGLTYDRDMMPGETKDLITLRWRGEMSKKTLSCIPKDLWDNLNEESWKDPDVIPNKEWLEWLNQTTKRSSVRSEKEEKDMIDKFYHYLSSSNWLIDVFEFPRFIEEKYVQIKKDYLDKLDPILYGLDAKSRRDELKGLVSQFVKAFKAKQNDNAKGNEHLVDDVIKAVNRHMTSHKSEDMETNFHDIFAMLYNKGTDLVEEISNTNFFNTRGSGKRLGDEEGQEKSKRGRFDSESSRRFTSSASTSHFSRDERKEKSSSSSFSHKGSSERSGSKSTSSGRDKDRGRDKERLLCDNCGQHTHSKDNCSFRGHPECNARAYVSPFTRWSDSEAKKNVQSKYSSEYFRLSFVPTADQDKYKHSKSESSVKSSKDSKGDCCNNCRDHHILLLLNDAISNSYTFPLNILLQGGESVEAAALLDTGALAGNFITSRLANTLINSYGVVSSNSESIICSAFANNCKRSEGSIRLNLKYLDEFNEIHFLSCIFKIADIDFELILGRDTIKHHNLFSQFPSCIQYSSESPGNASVNQISSETSPESRTIEERLTVERMETTPKEGSYSNVSTLDPYNEEELGDLESHDLEAIPSEYLTSSSGIETSPLIFGPPSLQEKLNTFVSKYKERFQTTISKVPAAVIPFTFNVNTTEWHTKKNQLGSRHLDRTKAIEIKRQTDIMLNNSIIKPSMSAYYSHGFLVPKKGKTWRFVIDFKNLNKVSSTEGWPLPDIRVMIQRLGSKRAKFFSVMDLTSGYHQASVDPSCTIFTAFRAGEGIYEWLRLPMGLKGAPSYFQRTMRTQVLQGLHDICEAYLDDLIVFGRTEEELIENLSKVFERLQHFNITLNPTKCRFGLREVEYVGHTINEFGHHFSREKLDGVKNFVLPVNQQGLKQFLGLANYFRDHVREHSLIVQPLHSLLRSYSPHKVIVWTDETKAAFEEIKKRIDECPLLFFLDEVSPIYLYTDASQLGMGAFLCQIVNGVEKPIAILSKAFDARMQRWKTIEQEGFAIFYALNQWDYLLRDRKFFLKTDHRNLTLLKQSSTPKVVRWMLAIQAFDFEISHIKGTDNHIADALSRLCPIEEQPEGVDRISDLHFPKLEELKFNFISKAHNFEVGHGGVDRTLSKLESLPEVSDYINKNGWRSMKTDVKHFIQQCPCCQKMNVIKPKIISRKFITSSTTPMERIAIDYIESLPPDGDGNDMIIVIIDCFTRFINLYPVKSTTAEACVKSLMKWVGTFGIPSIIQTDRGTQFSSNLMRDFVSIWGMDHKMTIADSKEENGIVERANREVFRHLKNILFEKNVVSHGWAQYVPLVQRIMNSCKHDSTGVTPAQLLFGNAINLDRGVLFELPSTSEHHEESVQNWQHNMTKMQNLLIQSAKEHLDARNESHLSADPITNGNNVTEFAPNTYVLVEQGSAFRKGPDNKLLPFLKGPMRVVNKLPNSDIYTLQNLITMRTKEYHVSKMREFLFDPETEDPLDSAVTDDHVYRADFIVDMKGSLKGPKSKLYFRVRWKGYQPSDDTWEPWANVRKLIVFRDFLTQHANPKVRSLLPKNVIYEEELDEE